MPQKFEFSPVGMVCSPVVEPADDNAWGGVKCRIDLDSSRFIPDCLMGLADFSHVEVVFLFLRGSDFLVFPVASTFCRVVCKLGLRSTTNSSPGTPRSIRMLNKPPYSWRLGPSMATLQLMMRGKKRSSPPASFRTAASSSGAVSMLRNVICGASVIGPPAGVTRLIRL